MDLLAVGLFLACRTAVSAESLSAAEFLLDAEKRESTLSPDKQQLVTETHAASLRLREAALRNTIVNDTCYPSGDWGDNLWCLAALYLNEKSNDANTRLLKCAENIIATNGKAFVGVKFLDGSYQWDEKA